MNILTIGGSDPSSGAGIQSDIKTFLNFNVYGLTAITAVTSQNTKKVLNIEPVSKKSLKSQIPFGPYIITAGIIYFFYGDILYQIVLRV